ncbi:MAG: hypothetical protein UT33_C0005G0094 [Candidatus Peregrinibacteria bacterium GW2011_GWC2_39_14]|nr:MAG: hypothetical protein US92_C0001G0094 [Candidatus Peregrinibacteria bacterium GW2011_GWA2_38_36]KKR07150.1 MAG: hypothetical protein UT33_C0005G0094 [Candidatus Peregrinibacteria bacterium GW2011_GWC2_39_14]
MPASRSTISFSEQNWKKLSDSDNKSKIVNTALKFFFDSKDLLKKREEEFILNELCHYEKTGESYGFDETFK